MTSIGEGFASINLFPQTPPTPYRVPSRRDGFDEDADALSSDWNALGDDFSHVIARESKNFTHSELRKRSKG